EMYGKAIADEWLSFGMSESEFAVFTAFADAVNHTIDDLAKGRDLFFGYFPSMTVKGVRLNAGIYKVQMLREGGQWAACFYEKPSEARAEELKVKLKPPGDRVVIEPMPAETKLGYGRLSGGIIFDRTLGPALEFVLRWDDPKMKLVPKGSFIISPKMDCG
ncbi:MAG: hypothetical protein N3E40_04220, partial [Dehalococcoidia bacterium]|nr:hypothetical protein [Dehalococcoidia bacterium]